MLKRGTRVTYKPSEQSAVIMAVKEKDYLIYIRGRPTFWCGHEQVIERGKPRQDWADMWDSNEED
jgi:hypothetical protein